MAKAAEGVSRRVVVLLREPNHLHPLWKIFKHKFLISKTLCKQCIENQNPFKANQNMYIILVLLILCNFHEEDFDLILYHF